MVILYGPPTWNPDKPGSTPLSSTYEAGAHGKFLGMRALRNSGASQVSWQLMQGTDWAVFCSWLCVGVLTKRALPFRIYIRPFDFLKLSLEDPGSKDQPSNCSSENQTSVHAP